MSNKSRRSFIRNITGATLASSIAPSLLTSSDDHKIELQVLQKKNRKKAANDQVNVAVIGMGIMGFNNAETTVQIPGVKLVGVCDLYTGRSAGPALASNKSVFEKKIILWDPETAKVI